MITGASGTVAAGLVPLCVEKLVEEEAIKIRISLVLFIVHKGLVLRLSISHTEKYVSVGTYKHGNGMRTRLKRPGHGGSKLIASQ